MLQTFAEADARVQGNAIFGQARGRKPVQAALEKIPDLAAHIRIARIALHGFRTARAVHQHVTGLVLDQHIQQFRIKSAG